VTNLVQIIVNSYSIMDKFIISKTRKERQCFMYMNALKKRSKKWN